MLTESISLQIDQVSCSLSLPHYSKPLPKDQPQGIQTLTVRLAALGHKKGVLGHGIISYSFCKNKLEHPQSPLSP